MREDPVSLYGFINAKLRAKIGLMRQSRISDEMLKADTLVDAVSVLRDSRYPAVAEAFDRTGDLQHMELVLLNGEIAMYREVEKYLEGTSATFVRHLLGKIEVDNLKNSLRLWYSSIIRRRPIRYRSEYLYKQTILYPIDWTALVNATTWESLTKALKESPYYTVVQEYGEQKLQDSGLFNLENELDKLWYVHLVEQIQHLQANDREVAMSIFLLEIDLRNLLMLVRFGWYYQMEGNRLEALLLPWGKVVSSKETKQYLSKKPDQRDVRQIIGKTFPGLNQNVAFTVRGSVHQDETSVLENLKIEGYLMERRQAMYQRLLAADPFTIGLPLAYFFLCKQECTMIRAILNGKYYGYDEDYIRGVLA